MSCETDSRDREGKPQREIEDSGRLLLRRRQLPVWSTTNPFSSLVSVFASVTQDFVLGICVSLCTPTVQGDEVLPSLGGGVTLLRKRMKRASLHPNSRDSSEETWGTRRPGRGAGPTFRLLSPDGASCPCGLSEQVKASPVVLLQGLRTQAMPGAGLCTWPVLTIGPGITPTLTLPPRHSPFRQHPTHTALQLGGVENPRKVRLLLVSPDSSVLIKLLTDPPPPSGDPRQPTRTHAHPGLFSEASFSRETRSEL